LVTAVSTTAFKQAIGMLRRGGACVLNGLPPGEFPISIFDVVLSGYTIRGSIVGTRLDMEKALAFAAEGKVKQANIAGAGINIAQRCSGFIVMKGRARNSRCFAIRDIAQRTQKVIL
jgi:D-arabinose 1-dehydrogenase-like Zn-dependent alcohol dehydrogenase